MESTDLKQSSPDASAPATQAPPKPVKVPMPRKKKKWIKRIIVLVVLIAVVVFLLRSCSGGSTALTSGIYLPSTASTQDLVVSVSGTGAIEPLHSYKVTTLVKGEVLEAPFEEGQTVHKGDLLFRIDSTDVETSIEQAQLSLESARLNYQQLLKNQDDSHKNATVEANATGVITKLYVDEGDMVSAGAPIADILDRDNMKLKVPFHSADAAGFYVGQSATVTVDGTMETLPGTIDTIAATDSVGPGGTLVRDITIVVRNPGALTDTSMGTASIGTASSASSGTFAYGESKQVVAKTSGELTSLTVKEGDRVMEDQVMGGFDETDMETQIENAAIQVQNAELTLKNAQDRLEDYSITSTIDGTVIEKNYDVGDTLDTSNASTDQGPDSGAYNGHHRADSCACCRAGTHHADFSAALGIFVLGLLTAGLGASDDIPNAIDDADTAKNTAANAGRSGGYCSGGSAGTAAEGHAGLRQKRPYNAAGSLGKPSRLAASGCHSCDFSRKGKLPTREG